VKRKLNIAIAGAGPAGLAAALLLKRTGHRVRVFERFASAMPVGSGLILQPTGLTVLDHLGLLPSMLALGSRIDRLHGCDARSGRTVLDVRYDAQNRGRFGLAVHRAALFGVLHEASVAEGIEIVTDTTVETLRSGAGGAELLADSGRSLGGCDLVVDASGSRSRLRRQCTQPAEPRALAYGAFWASLAWCGEGFDPHALTQRYDRASVMIGVLPIGRPAPAAAPMAAFFWSLKPAEAETVRLQGLQALKDRIMGLWPDCAPYLTQIESFEQLTLARYGHHTLRSPIGERLAIIGDAAHSASPQLGQGANMALLDAAALAHAVATEGDIGGALAAYAKARGRHVRLFQALSWMFTPFYQSDSILLPMIRDRLVATVAKIPPAPQLLASMVAGTLLDPFKPTGLVETNWRDVRLASVQSKV
jgi:2-polyprenyl-6-methoxyphenol hydroxylase-like FAD-dependent oxidoreductase